MPNKIFIKKKIARRPLAIDIAFRTILTNTPTSSDVAYYFGRSPKVISWSINDTLFH
jgi:hypothetical protein